jgi:hypothetical protein
VKICELVRKLLERGELHFNLKSRRKIEEKYTHSIRENTIFRSSILPCQRMRATVSALLFFNKKFVWIFQERITGRQLLPFA